MSHHPTRANLPEYMVSSFDLADGHPHSTALEHLLRGEGGRGGVGRCYTCVTCSFPDLQSSNGVTFFLFLSSWRKSFTVAEFRNDGNLKRYVEFLMSVFISCQR